MSRAIVVIDPGHGGAHSNGGSSPFGVCGSNGSHEKDITLALARRLAGRLSPDARAVLTREDDSNPSLAQRADVAQRERAQVFVSLHANGGLHGARGSEIYVHDRADGRSEALAHRLSAALAGTGVPQRGTYRAPMALLQPASLGPTAACLVEVDYLSHPEGEARLRDPRELDAIAAQLSDGVRAYLGDTTRAEMPARALDDGNYFTDADELGRYLRDQRASNTERRSTVADARALVDAYIRSGAPTVWSHLDAPRTAGQIRDRCGNHRLFQQGNLNLCGPAVFLHIWAGRDPVGYARYALGLLEHGRGTIGSHTVRATQTLMALRYPRLGRPTTMTTPEADFLAMAPLRDSANEILPYDPASGSESLQASTTPEEVTEWLQWTGQFRTVRNEANWVRSRGYDHAMGNLPGGTSDIAMLINTNALASARAVEHVSGSARTNPVTPDRSFILNMFPNHFVALLGEIVRDVSDDTLSMSVWTWGGSYVFEGVPLRRFMENYYGTITTRMR